VGAGTVHLSFKGVFQLTVRANQPPNAVSFTNVRGDFTFVPDDSALPTATGHFTSVDMGAGGTNAALTGVLNTRGTTSDGTKIGAHARFHLTENGVGVIVVEFEKLGCNQSPRTTSPELGGQPRALVGSGVGCLPGGFEAATPVATHRHEHTFVTGGCARRRVPFSAGYGSPCGGAGRRGQEGRMPDDVERVPSELVRDNGQNGRP
jgi:hypothetical protein